MVDRFDMLVHHSFSFSLLPPLNYLAVCTCACRGQADGTVLGIDFGLAFGAGVTTIPIPELLPFRCGGDCSDDTALILTLHL